MGFPLRRTRNSQLRQGLAQEIPTNTQRQGEKVVGAGWEKRYEKEAPIALIKFTLPVPSNQGTLRQKEKGRRSPEKRKKIDGRLEHRRREQDPRDSIVPVNSGFLTIGDDSTRQSTKDPSAAPHV